MRGVTRWTIGKATATGHRFEHRAEWWRFEDAETSKVYFWNVATACCSPYSVAQYLDKTAAWRPLDIHPDWRTWDGATTKGNK